MRAVSAFWELRRSRWWTFVVRPVVFLVISFLVGRVLISLVGSVDWQQVGIALRKVSWAQVPLLLALLVLRQGFNAVPLSVFVPGLGLWRALQNDLTANLVGTVAPPPSDVVLRVSMFRSWGISAVDGMPGVTLNSLVFYVIRFSVPVLGVLLLIGEDLSGAQVWLSVLSLLVAALMVSGLVLVSRGERAARVLGVQAARVASRFRDDVDVQAWGDAVSGFRATMSQRLVRGLPPSMGALTAMVLTDGVIVLTGLRVVGVPSTLLPTVLVLGTFLLVYPLTALPLAGLGVLDAALVVAYTEVAGLAAEPAIVAGLVLWRVVTILGSLALGGLSLGWWRWRRSRRPSTDGMAPAAR
jgi:hypothetical protein